MLDPVLAAYEVADCLYVISGPAPISIRDQIVRGATIVDRLLDSGALDDDLLIVVGAGVGGVAAAIRAAEAGVRVLLLDRASRAFSFQHRASTRYLNPTQYDWPVDHFAEGILPWGRQAGLPLRAKADYASVLALSWEADLAAACKTFSNLSFIPHTGVSKIQTVSGPNGLPTAPVVVLDDSSRFNCGVVIWAAGRADENVEFVSSGMVQYEGLPFWAPDSLTTATGASDRVLISGAGDGALQDVVRAITGDDRISRIATSLVLPASILRSVQSAEDRAHRGRAWLAEDSNGKSIGEEDWLHGLEDTHLKAVRSALRNPATLSALASSLKSDRPTVHVVYRGSYLSPYYGLNRFLATLYDAYLLLRFNERLLFPDCEIERIAPSAADFHYCTADKGGGGHACFKREHQVTFKASTAGAPPPDGDYNVILIRHGLKQPPTPNVAQELLLRKQLLPYHMP